MARPLIGLTTYAEHARFSTQDTLAAALPMSYVRAVQESGGQAILITPEDPDVELLDRLDGIVFSGGGDLDPAWYGEEPHPKTTFSRDRDEAELNLLRAALTRDMPMLGVCRGMQLMTVAYGGRLHQHLPDVVGHDLHRPVSGPKYGEHPVRLLSGTRAAAVHGGELITVNSFHHQGIADPGGLVPTGWCPLDNIVEVAEDPDRHFVLGVQWHPEVMADHRVFAALVDAAKSRRLTSVR